MRLSRKLSVGVILLALAGVACSNASGTPSSANRKVALRLGYFPNITHATALVGVANGIFARALGSNVQLQPKIFNAGPAAVEALFAGALDASYVGPNPAINAFLKSSGRAVRIISGATSGGAAFVVQPGIEGPADLKGKTVASPQLGNTQDVALRSWLAAHGLRTNTSGGGDAHITPQDNAQTLQVFRTGKLAGAWVPEPWASRLVIQGGGKVLVNEGDLWPGGRYVTTQLVVRTAFLKDHPDVVRALLRGQVEANDFLNKHAADAQALANRQIANVTGKSLPADIVASAWKGLTFTNDPIASSLRKDAEQARALGLLKTSSIDGIFDLSLLNQVLVAAGEPQVPIS